MSHALPWSRACENNKRPILALLREYLPASRRVLEIGSGTAQHAAFFAPELPHLSWLTSDRVENHAGIRARLAREPAPNLEPPLELDVAKQPWPQVEADAVFSANTAHIMHWPEVVDLFAGVSALLPCGGLFLLYGPFRYGDRHTSDSNRAFDASLRASDPEMGIRDAQELDRVAGKRALLAVADHAMPANNRTLIWRKA